MTTATLVPHGWPRPLEDCPPGPFCIPGVTGKRAGLGFKTEYGKITGRDMGGGKVEWTMTDKPDAYTLESGEQWCGDTLVQPLRVEWEEP